MRICMSWAWAMSIANQDWLGDRSHHSTACIRRLETCHLKLLLKSIISPRFIWAHSSFLKIPVPIDSRIDFPASLLLFCQSELLPQHFQWAHFTNKLQIWTQARPHFFGPLSNADCPGKAKSKKESVYWETAENQVKVWLRLDWVRLPAFSVWQVEIN